jgi:hypothetical protein
MIRYGPHEGGKFSGSCRYDGIAVFAFCHQSPEPGTKPRLALPCNIPDFLA